MFLEPTIELDVYFDIGGLPAFASLGAALQALYQTERAEFFQIKMLNEVFRVGRVVLLSCCTSPKGGKPLWHSYTASHLVDRSYCFLSLRAGLEAMCARWQSPAIVRQRFWRREVRPCAHPVAADAAITT